MESKEVIFGKLVNINFTPQSKSFVELFQCIQVIKKSIKFLLILLLMGQSLGIDLLNYSDMQFLKYFICLITVGHSIFNQFYLWMAITLPLFKFLWFFQCWGFIILILFQNFYLIFARLFILNFELWYSSIFKKYFQNQLLPHLFKIE